MPEKNDAIGAKNNVGLQKHMGFEFGLIIANVNIFHYWQFDQADTSFFKEIES